MKVIIITEIGKNIGYGHFVRCSALKNAFFNAGFKTQLLIQADDSQKDLASEESFEAFAWWVDNENLIKCIMPEDIVVIDSYFAPVNLYEDIAKKARLCVYLDDTNRIDYPSGVIVNGALYAQRIYNEKKLDTVYLLGGNYAMLRRAFTQSIEKKIGSDIKKIIITLGGSSSGDLTLALKSYLNERIRLQIDCIGINSKRMSSDEIRQAMIGADVCICAGGQTTFELARCGTPAIGICLADNQLRNLQSWKEVGFLEFVGWNDEKDLFGKILKVLKNLSYDKRKKMSQIGQNYIDGQGSHRVVREVVKHAKNRNRKQVDWRESTLFCDR